MDRPSEAFIVSLISHKQMCRPNNNIYLRKSGLDYAACSKQVPARDGKDQGEDIAQSKRVRAGSLAIVD